MNKETLTEPIEIEGFGSFRIDTQVIINNGKFEFLSLVDNRGPKPVYAFAIKQNQLTWSATDSERVLGMYCSIIRCEKIHVDRLISDGNCVQIQIRASTMYVYSNEFNDASDVSELFRRLNEASLINK